MNDEILISVVLPFFNGREFVKETLESIAGQTFGKFEVILVDDGSTDKTQSEFARSAVDSLGDPRFKYMFKDNGGLSDARNFGLRASRGAWAAFIDQDDVWDARKLEKQVAVLNGRPEAEFIFTDGKLIGTAHGNMNVASKNGLKEGFVRGSYTRLLKGNFVICSSVLFRKTLLEKVGYSNASFKIIPDYEYIIRFAERADFYFIPEPLVSYRIHGANTVKNRLKQAAETMVLLSDRKLTTKSQKALATYNLVRTILELGVCWVRKILEIRS